MDLKELIKESKDTKNWVREVELIDKIKKELVSSKSCCSVRAISELTEKSKSWIGVSLQLARAIRVFPEIRFKDSRNEAYQFVLKKRKIQSRFLEI